MLLVHLHLIAYHKQQKSTESLGAILEPRITNHLETTSKGAKKKKKKKHRGQCWI